jgi:mannitol-specific phosphotransferase system IIBC component
MNRVAKKFFGKLLPPVGMIVYVFAAMHLAGYAEDPLYGLFTIGFMVIGPMVGYMLRETWLQAKREVEYENELMINTLKDS